MGLEAWYLWDAQLEEEDWLVWPGEILSMAGEGDKVTDEINDRRAQIYSASIKLHKTQWRVSCAALLRETVEISGRHEGDILVHREPESLSVWTPSAYQTHFSKIS